MYFKNVIWMVLLGIVNCAPGLRVPMRRGIGPASFRMRGGAIPGRIPWRAAPSFPGDGYRVPGRGIRVFPSGGALGGPGLGGGFRPRLRPIGPQRGFGGLSGGIRQPFLGFPRGSLGGGLVRRRGGVIGAVGGVGGIGAGVIGRRGRRPTIVGRPLRRAGRFRGVRVPSSGHRISRPMRIASRQPTHFRRRFLGTRMPTIRIPLGSRRGHIVGRGRAGITSRQDNDHFGSGRIISGSRPYLAKTIDRPVGIQRTRVQSASAKVSGVVGDVISPLVDASGTAVDGTKVIVGEVATDAGTVKVTSDTTETVDVTGEIVGSVQATTIVAKATVGDSVASATAVVDSPVVVEEVVVDPIVTASGTTVVVSEPVVAGGTVVVTQGDVAVASIETGVVDTVGAKAESLVASPVEVPTSEQGVFVGSVGQVTAKGRESIVAGEALFIDQNPLPVDTGVVTKNVAPVDTVHAKGKGVVGALDVGVIDIGTGMNVVDTHAIDAAVAASAEVVAIFAVDTPHPTAVIGGSSDVIVSHDAPVVSSAEVAAAVRDSPYVVPSETAIVH